MKDKQGPTSKANSTPIATSKPLAPGLDPQLAYHNQEFPESAIASGCIDFILSPEDIAQEIVRIAHAESRAE
jgi:chemotaxis response regulator CheB